MQESIKRTEQQERIIESDVDCLVVNALAGTGKTSSLREFARARSNKKLLYIAFNKGIVEEARGKFPANTKIMTSHGIAFSKVGKVYASEDKLTANIRPFQVNQIINIKNRKDVPTKLINLYVHRVMSTLNKFISSSDPYVTVDMVSLGDKSEQEIKYFNKENIAKDAQLTWNAMCDVNNKEIGMTHDGYLKIFTQMGSPMDRYDYILFDEAQDSTPTTLDMVMAQKARKVFVGDPNQSIYKFRGSVDALDKIVCDKKLMLTNSFRFGESVAGVANMLLAYRKSEYLVSGVGGEDSVGLVGNNIKHAFISRGNMTILDKSAELIAENKKIHFIGGYESYRFSQLMDVYNLKYRSGEIKDPFISSFDNYEDFSLYSEESMDVDFLSRVHMVNKYERRIPQIIASAEKNSAPMDQADVFLTTAHKAKGLEFDNVKLADDFIVRTPIINDENLISPTSMVDMEEVNLAYVAATRARNTLDIGTNQSNIKIAYENKALREITRLEVLTKKVLSKLNTSMEEVGLAAPSPRKLRSI